MEVTVRTGSLYMAHNLLAISIQNTCTVLLLSNDSQAFQSQTARLTPKSERLIRAFACGPDAKSIPLHKHTTNHNHGDSEREAARSATYPYPTIVVSKLIHLPGAQRDRVESSILSAAAPNRSRSNGFKATGKAHARAVDH